MLLESGDRIPADLRLLSSYNLEVDEALLTGESEAVPKYADRLLHRDTTLGDRCNMLFAGSIINRGRGQGVVVGTALLIELGKIAASVLNRPPTKAPLLIRMERFTHGVAMIVGVMTILMLTVALMRGIRLAEMFQIAVALAVSSILEGLPAALTAALSIGMRRMARRNVNVLELVAVESLPSCTFIAADKTGTLTINQLTARRLVFPGLDA